MSIIYGIHEIYEINIFYNSYIKNDLLDITILL